MRDISKVIVISAACALFMGCGPAVFSTMSSANKAVAGGESPLVTGSETGDATGQVPQGDDAAGQVPQGDDVVGDAAGQVPQPTLDEFLNMAANNSPDFSAVAENNRCYISHGGGHGIDLCMSGDKSAIANFWPIEIRGNAICVPLSTVQANRDLFAGATLGECQ